MKYLYLLISFFVFTSCTDVIDLPLTEGAERLVIDANINWLKGSSGSEQSIRLTKTTGFYATEIPAANNALVSITDGTKEFVFTEEGTTGIYKTTAFEPEINKTYTLNITYNGEKYTASEKLTSITTITDVIQTTENFFGNEVIRVDFVYTDPIDEENYYLGEFSSNAFLLNNYRVWKDEFINGNEDTAFEIDENFKTGDVLKFRFYGISKDYQNYLSLLLQQTQSGGPFATPPAAVNGNCKNLSNGSKPLGYFKLSQVEEKSYIIQ